jgi:hypothetical protein
MAMYAIVMGGMTPVGALVAGALAQAWGAPGALAVGGALGLLATGGILYWRVRDRAALSRATDSRLSRLGGEEAEGAGEDG